MEISLAENIRRFRRERRLTQEQLAETLGVTAGAVYKWEAALSLPEITTLTELADFFDCSVDVLLGYGVKDNRIDATVKRLRRCRIEKDEAGLSECEKALKKYPNSFEVVYASAQLYCRFGVSQGDKAKLERALEVLSDAVLLLPQNTDPKIGENEVLHGVTAKLRAGGSYAVVGASGSGKSTLLKLLTAENSGYSGHIRLDGTELSELAPESLYEMMSVIQQNVFVFNASITDNITMFRSFPEDELRSALRCAHLDELIAKRGGDCLCGENGKELSGGEKQRISIARSLLKRSSVLLADEATAALDAQTAHRVTSDILDLDGITRIVVTHSLEESLLRRFDGIVVMRDGRIEELGSFTELMEKRGYFRALYTVSE